MICRHLHLEQSQYSDYDICVKCGTLVHKDPLTSQEAYETGYWEPESAHGGIYDQVYNCETHKENGVSKVEFVLQRIPAHSHHVAEIACAPGSLMNALLRDGYADQVTGFEVDQRYEKDIRAIAARPVDLRFGYFPFSAKDIPDDSVDTVIALDFFEHMHFPVNVAKAFHRLLNHNGTLFLMLPMAEDDGTVGELRMLHPEHCFLFSKKYMTDLFTEIGFKDIQFDQWCPGHSTFQSVKA